MKKLAYLAAVVLVCAVGFFAVQQYHQHQLVRSIAPRLKNASLRLMNSTRQEVEKTANVTYEEAINTLQADITEVGQHLLQVQTLASSANSSTTTPAIEYLEAIQETQRAALAKYRKSLMHSLQSEKSKTVVEDARLLANSNASEVIDLEIQIRRLNAVRADLDKSLSEYDDARLHFYKTASMLEQKRMKAAPIYSSDVLIAAEWIHAVEKENSERINPFFEK